MILASHSYRSVGIKCYMGQTGLRELSAQVMASFLYDNTHDVFTKSFKKYPIAHYNDCYDLKMNALRVDLSLRRFRTCCMVYAMGRA